MRKILSLVALHLMVAIASCSKNSSPKPPAPSPTLTVEALPITAWYSGTSTISWSTTNTDSVHVNGVKVNGSSFVTTSLTAPVTFTIKAFGPGGSVTRTITVAVWSQKTTLMANYGNWKNIYSVSYKQADSLNPALYNYLPIDSVNCKSIKYNTNTFSYMGIISGFGGQIMQGCGNPAVSGSFTWDLQNNETEIAYDIGTPSIPWKIDTLNTSLLRLSQNRPDSTGIVLHYVRRFVH